MLNNNIFTFKNDYKLTLIFSYKSYSFKNLVYKIFFNSNMTHVDLVLDYKYDILTTFENGVEIKETKENTNIIDYIDINKYNKRINKIIEINITEKEYYKIFCHFNNLNNKKYSYFSIFKNIFNKDRNLELDNSLICTELSEIILKKINLKVNNRYSVINFYNNIIKQLKNNKRVYRII